MAISIMSRHSSRFNESSDDDDVIIELDDTVDMGSDDDDDDDDKEGYCDVFDVAFCDSRRRRRRCKTPMALVKKRTYCGQ